ncbi:sulfur carrier protein ThiS [Spirochaetota bacterium]|nr:sulfur carrier protein ThiS [Spirochaetota bacterium]
MDKSNINIEAPRPKATATAKDKKTVASGEPAVDEIEIMLNGEPVKINKQTSLLDLFNRYNIPPINCAVELNENIVPHSEYAKTPLNARSVVEIVRFVGGG